MTCASLGKHQEHHSFSTLGNWPHLGKQTDIIISQLGSNKYLYNLTHLLSFIIHLPCTSVAEQIRENIVNIKETQEELKKEVDSLVLEHLKQQQQTPKALNIRESLQTLTRKVTQLETTLEQVKSHVDYMLSDYLESLESIIGQLEVEQ